jgi:pyrroline-5-carboxylate reductase
VGKWLKPWPKDSFRQVSHTHATKLFLKILSGLAKGETMISSCHPSDVASAKAFKDMGAESLFENVPVVEKSDVIIVSVKPSVVPIALGDIKNAPDIKADKLFLSIAMGVTIKQLEQVRTSPASAQTHKFVSVLAERVSSGAGDA